MPFSNKAYLCKCLYSWADAKRYFENTAKPESEVWEENERPLRPGDAGKRQHHYRIANLGDHYSMILHETEVVGFSPGEIRVDLTYPSRMTRDFALNYLPSFIGRLSSYRSQKILEVKGVFFKLDKPFHFVKTKKPDTWRLVSENNLAEKEILNKKVTAQLSHVFKPFAQWVDGVWGVCNESAEGSNHPWRGTLVNNMEQDACPWFDGLYPVINHLVKEDFVKAVKQCLPYINTGRGLAEYAPCDKAAIKRKVKERLYRQEKAYVIAPYNYVDR